MLTREECLERLTGFFGQGELGIMIYVPEKGEYLALSIGTGDQLLDEDLVAGYDSYINICGYSYDCDFDDEDGGILLYDSEKENYDEDICNAVYDVLVDRYETALDFIPIHFL